MLRFASKVRLTGGDSCGVDSEVFAVLSDDKVVLAGVNGVEEWEPVWRIG